MFIKLLKKKKTSNETNEFFPTMTEEEILQGIIALKKRSKQYQRNIIFCNATINKKTIKKLNRKGYMVEIFIDEYTAPGFKVSW